MRKSHFRFPSVSSVVAGCFAAACLAFPAPAPAPARIASSAGSDGFRAYVCDSSRSTVVFHAVHPFANVTGINHAPACSVWVNGDSTIFRVRVNMAVRGFKTGISLRDSHTMKAVEADAFPQVAFASTAVKPKDGKLGPYVVNGELTFHGLTKTITANVTPEIKAGQVFIRGGFPISLAEYQAKPPTLMGTKVHDRVDMTFDLVFKLRPGE